MTFTLDLGSKGIDPRLCLRMGQVFRFSALPDGSLTGVEGSLALSLTEVSQGVWQIQTNGSMEEVESFFRLDTLPVAVFQRCLALDPRLAPFLHRLEARLTLLRPTSFVEAIFGFLCSQNNHLARIMPMVQHLGSLGEPIGEMKGQRFWSFPSLEVLADTSEDSLKKAGFGYRAAHVPAAANRILALGGEAWLADLRTCEYEEAVSALVSLPGVGRKLAECILLYGADRTESVPVDTHLWRMAAPLYLAEEADCPNSPARSAKLSREMRARFGSLAGWAHLLLFAASLGKGLQARQMINHHLDQ